ncbi:transglutaminaseTgpA domain-containing protein [Oceanobacter mangrovi]|uniref:transglutaminase family protein n=1 Tax=Oceanobacter mangrovi TaxID=2862510 RepID=UPI001C8D1316|nr:DUF3488 and transglutaminase-like domain-containing protein [Oceanobacter mangrovi]
MSASLKQPLGLPRAALLWLLGSSLAALLPHYSHLPILVWVIAAAIVGWRWLMFRGVLPYPGKITKVLAVTAVAGAVVAGFSGRYTLESATAFFVAMSLLKLLEMRNQRDGFVVVFLAAFLLAVGFLFEQGIGWGLFGIVELWLLLATLVALQLGSSQLPMFAVIHRHTNRLMLVSLPVMLVFYLFFPRLAPLWTFNLQAEKAKTGLSETMSPGDIASLSQSGELAFRVTFDSGQQLPRQQLYWRAMVLDEYDGRRWSFSRRGRDVDWFGSGNDYQPSDADTGYEIIQEATSERWLFSLRNGAALEQGIGYTSTDLLVSRLPVYQRKRYRSVARATAASTPAYLPLSQRQFNLQLPESGNPRLRQWVREQLAAGTPPEQLMNSLLERFRQSFVYTLKPPVLGADDIDQFLFDSQRGFCAHYAGAFVYTARLAGIPARVVAGYQGGQWNSTENYLSVRQYDAHAWAELWRDGQGWVRVDPTAAVSPARIELGLEEAMREEGSFMEDSLIKPAQLRQLGWLYELSMKVDSINYLWQRWVLSYDKSRQQQLLQSFMTRSSFMDMVWWLIAAVLAAFAVMTLLMVLRAPSQKQSRIKQQWEKLLLLARHAGINAESGASPLSVIAQLQQSYPDLKTELAVLQRRFDQHLYAPDGATADTERQLLLQLKLCQLLIKRSKPVQFEPAV